MKSRCHPSPLIGSSLYGCDCSISRAHLHHPAVPRVGKQSQRSTGGQAGAVAVFHTANSQLWELKQCCSTTPRTKARLSCGHLNESKGHLVVVLLWASSWHSPVWYHCYRPCWRPGSIVWWTMRLHSRTPAIHLHHKGSHHHSPGTPHLRLVNESFNLWRNLKSLPVPAGLCFS